MARLIDAHDLWSDIMLLPHNGDMISSEEVEQAIIDAKTVDAVEVVRCKDCKHWHEGTGWCNHHSHFVDTDGEACHPWESNNWKMLDPDDFCSFGERKAE